MGIKFGCYGITQLFYLVYEGESTEDILLFSALTMSGHVKIIQHVG